MTAADKKPFATAMATLAVALREASPDVIQMRTYFDILADLEIEFVVAAAEHLMSSAQWFPKVSEWRAAAVRVERERLDAQRAFIRRLPAPLCAACGDTNWRSDGDGRVRQCECRQQRRLELLGRLPWPALPAGQPLSSACEEDAGKDAAIVALARLEQLGRTLDVRDMPNAITGDHEP